MRRLVGLRRLGNLLELVQNLLQGVSAFCGLRHEVIQSGDGGLCDVRLVVKLHCPYRIDRDDPVVFESCGTVDVVQHQGDMRFATAVECFVKAAAYHLQQQPCGLPGVHADTDGQPIRIEIESFHCLFDLKTCRFTIGLKQGLKGCVGSGHDVAF